jgi:hypothetical protein
VHEKKYGVDYRGGGRSLWNCQSSGWCCEVQMLPDKN